MSDRAHAWAERLERANADFIAVVESLSDADWRGRCEAEGWTVAATARHVGSSHALIASWVRAVATGQPPTMERDELDQINGREAPAFAACSKDEAVAVLRREGEAAARLIRGLSDEQLDRTGLMLVGARAPRTAESIIERILIPHIEEHLGSIQAA